MKIFINILFSLFLITSAHAQTGTAGLLNNALQQFFDNNGNPLSGGSVTFYVPGTTTLKTVWKNSTETIVWSNPIILDAGGKPPGSSAGIYGEGSYRQIVKDRNGNTVWDAVTAPSGGGGTPTLVGDGNLVGTVLPWSGVLAPNQYAFMYGQEISRTTYSALLTAVTYTTIVSCTTGSNIMTGIPDTGSIPLVGNVESACVPPGTTVTTKNVTTVTLSNPSDITLNTTATFFLYGNGNGTTTFNLPDFRGRSVIGRNNMGGNVAVTLDQTYYGTNPNAVGAVGGAQRNSLTINNLPLNNITTGITTGGTNISYTHDAGGTGTAFSIVQPGITLNYIIKIIPDTSASQASGVASLGGMTGVIACGTGLLCTGNVVSVTSGGTGVSSVVGTANQIAVSTVSGVATVSLPSIAETANFIADTGFTVNDQSGISITKQSAWYRNLDVNYFFDSAQGNLISWKFDGSQVSFLRYGAGTLRTNGAGLITADAAIGNLAATTAHVLAITNGSGIWGAGTCGNSIDCSTSTIDVKTNGIVPAMVSAGSYTNITGLGTVTATSITVPTLTGLNTPSANSDAANKLYVDSIASGIKNIGPSRLATAAVLPNTPTYSNGASGVGATLTATSGTTLTVDGTVAAANDIVLVKNQASQFQNGQYYVSAATTPWVLTRCTVANCGAKFDDAATMKAGSYTFITAGATLSNTSYNLQADVTTVGTTAAVFVLFANSSGVASLGGQTGVITCGSALTCSGSSINVASSGITNAMLAGSIDLTTKVTGVLPVANGGSGTSTAFTSGSTVFAGASGIYTQDHANFFYDATNHRLGLGTVTPLAQLHVNGPAYFQDGRPWADVKACGAVGNGSANDTAAIMRCYNKLTGSPVGGILFFPPGTYCVGLNTDDSTYGLIINTPGILLQGAGAGNAVALSARASCGFGANNYHTVSLNATHNGIANMIVWGSDPITGSIPSGDAINMGSNCTECYLDQVQAQFGRYNINVGAADITMFNIKASNPYASAVLYAQNGAFHLYRGKLDQTFPLLEWPIGFNVPNWAASTSYSPNQFVKYSGFIYQASNSGTTSSGTGPLPATYGSTIVDGSVAWFFVGEDGTSCVNIDSGTGVTFIYDTDCSGSFTYGLHMSDSMGGNPPFSIWVDGMTIDLPRSYCVYLQKGSQFSIQNSQISRCQYGILGSSTFSGDLNINHNFIIAHANDGINLDLFAEVATNIIGNNISGNTAWGVQISGNSGSIVTNINSNIFASVNHGPNLTGNVNVILPAGHCNVALNSSLGAAYNLNGCAGAGLNN